MKSNSKKDSPSNKLTHLKIFFFFSTVYNLNSAKIVFIGDLSRVYGSIFSK